MSGGVQDLRPRPRRCHPEIVLGNQSTRVMCEMVSAVDAAALGEDAGHRTLDEMRAVDEALELILDLG